MPYCCPKDPILGTGLLLGGVAVVSVSTQVYDSFETVLPLDESGDGTEDEFRDRTVNDHDGTGDDGIDLANVPTLDGGAYCLPSQHFDGRQWITGTIDDIDSIQPVTISLWGRIEPFFTERVFFSRGSLMLGHDYLNHALATVRVLGTERQVKTYYCVGSTIMAQEDFYHVALVWRPGGSLSVYLNGVLDGTTAIEELELAETFETFVGKSEDTNYLIGNVQELRLSGNARSDDWLLAEYENFCGDIYTVGETTGSTYF